MAWVKTTPRRGSSLSTKQLARTVIDGKAVTFFVPQFQTDQVTGYLCGMDDFHWMVITSGGDKYLIHKSAPAAHIAGFSTYDTEPDKDSLEEVVGPFRQYVKGEFFGQAAASASENLGASA